MDYMYGYKKNKKMKIIHYIMFFVIILVVGIIVWLLYDMYQQTEVKSIADNNNIIETKRVSQTIQQETSGKNITDVIEDVSNSVVGISKLKNNGTSIFSNESIQQLGLGTGIIVSENGYIITNQHVSGGKLSNCYVTLKNGKNYPATVIWANDDIDIAILKINAQGLQYAKIGNSDSIKTGEAVYAIGNPIGFEFQRTVTSGIISAVDRTIKIEENNKSSYMSDLIQTDATINPGNSGGPLITKNGEIIGINSIKITSAEGIGFAIPINLVKPILEKIQTKGKFEEAYLGIFAYDKAVIPYLDSNLNLENGIYVTEVSARTPAYKAGIKTQDIITKIDNVELNKMNELRTYIYSKEPGDEVTLTVLRNGKTSEIKVKLEKR